MADDILYRRMETSDPGGVLAFLNARGEGDRQTGRTSVAFSTHYGPTDENDLFALNRVEIFRRDRRPFAFSRKVRHLVAG